MGDVTLYPILPVGDTVHSWPSFQFQSNTEPPPAPPLSVTHSPHTRYTPPWLSIICTEGPDVIRKEAWSFYRTSSGVCLCWELEQPEGPKGLLRMQGYEALLEPHTSASSDALRAQIQAMKPLRLYGVAYRGTSATRKLRLEGWSVGIICLLAATPSPTSAPAPLPAQLMVRAHEERRGSTLGATQSRISPSTLQYEDNNEPRFGRAELEPPRPTPSTTRTPPDQHHLPFGRDPVAPVCPRTPTGPRSPLGPRCPSCLRGRCGGQMDVQGYLADKKKHPPP